MKYYTSQELIELFRVSRYALYRAQKSGALPVAKKEGVQNLYSEADVLRYIEDSGKAKTENK